MATLSEIIELIQRINDELNYVEHQASDGLILTRTILERFSQYKSITTLIHIKDRYRSVWKIYLE